MNDLKKIENSINAQKNNLYQIIKKPALLVCFLMWVFLSLLVTHSEKDIGDAFFYFVMFFCILIAAYMLVIFLLKFTVGGKETVLATATVEGFIREKKVEYFTPKTGTVTNYIYYLDVINSSPRLRTVTINFVQYDCVSEMYRRNPDKLIKTEVAILKPKAADLISSYTLDGTLVLLPFKEYVSDKDTAGKIVEDSAIDEQYVAPLQLGRQPVFNAARYPEIKENAQYEDVLTPGMSIIKFEHFDDVTLEQETVFEGDKLMDYSYIKDAISESGNVYNEFMDFRTREEPKVHRKGPNFLGYCLIFYAVNFFFIRNHSSFQDSYLFLNILITSVLVLGYAFFIYVPLRVSLPVRFHRNNDEVYLYEKQGLYKVPWQELDVSIVARKQDSDTIYDLVVWLPGKYNHENKNAPDTYRTLYSSSNIHGKVYFYWDYINRYMNFDPYFEQYIESDDKPKKKEKEQKDPTKGASLFDLFIGLVVFFMIPVVIIFLASDTSALRARLNPNKQKWPDIVHKWSGRISNWY
ncbi:DUF6708 domain-containing protein [Reinekea thalattae]|uniref:DUF6708 domain-containing protein n=1 Tax=Reinekea thalattae TaxID=2593301 RepID=A0A5C8Z491_9GAMM|nr:DUF6708 domain-containing protein [Reinekea thalattae]TXR52124.1 hypothetical protein FME95_11975 [Reinekea thalattae]